MKAERQSQKATVAAGSTNDHIMEAQDRSCNGQTTCTAYQLKGRAKREHRQVHAVQGIGCCVVQVDTSGRETQWGTGGMATKLTAARIATAAACTCVICSSAQPEVIPAIMSGKQQAGTLFHPLPNAVRLVVMPVTPPALPNP